MVLVAYDVSVEDAGGARRLRRVAKVCEDVGQRVQKSLFECILDPAQLAQLRGKLLRIIDPNRDTLRFYSLGKHWQRRVECYGITPSFDQDGPLIL